MKSDCGCNGKDNNYVNIDDLEIDNLEIDYNEDTDKDTFSNYFKENKYSENRNIEVEIYDDGDFDVLNDDSSNVEFSTKDNKGDNGNDWECNTPCKWDNPCSNDPCHNDDPCKWDDPCHNEDPCNQPCNNDIARIVLEKSVDKNFALYGDTLRYCILVRNIGTVNACNVIIRDNIDGCLNFIKGSLEINGVRTEAHNLGEFKIGTVRPSQCVMICFSVKIEDCCPETIENTATAEYFYLTNGGRNRVFAEAESNTVTTTVVSVCLEIEKFADKSSVRVGEELIYTIKIRNTCEFPVDNFVLRDELPRELECLEVTARNRHFNCRELDRGINIGAIPAGDTVVVCIKTVVRRFGDCGIITNIAVGIASFNGQVLDPIRSNEVQTRILFFECRSFSVNDVVKLSCNQGPAVRILDVESDVEVVRIEELRPCNNVKRVRVEGVVILDYLIDKGVTCSESVVSRVPFCVILKLPEYITSCDNLSVDIGVVDVDSKIECGFTILSRIKLELCIKSK